MNENLVLAHGDCNADFNRSKGVYKLGLLFRVFVNTFWIVSQNCFSYYCILTTEVCKMTEHVVFYFLNLRFTQSFYCDSFIYKKTKL